MGVFSAQGKTSLFQRDNPPPCYSAILSDFFWEEASARDHLHRVTGEGFLHSTGS